MRKVVGMTKIKINILFIFCLFFSFVGNVIASDLTGYKDWYDEDYRTFSDGNDALQWGNKLYQGSKFTAEEQQIIYQYSTGSTIFNSKLRSGTPFDELPKDEQMKINLLDSALKKFIVFEKVRVYRYENINLLERIGYSKEILYKDIYSNTKFTPQAEEYLKDITQRTYTDKGFMSTTLVKNALFHYRPIELVIKVPKYSDATFIARSGFTGFIHEYELLFPRNRTLHFEGFTISPDRKKLTLYAKMSGPLWIVNDKQ